MDEANEDEVLPSSEVELEIDVLAADRHAETDAVESDRPQHRIALVVADVALRAYVRRCVERSCEVRAEIVEYDDGAKALHRIEASGTDLIVCEADLPGIAGLELIETLSGNPRLTSIPVILLAGRSLPYAERRRVQGVEHVELVDKPFSARLLCTLVRRYLDDQVP